MVVGCGEREGGAVVQYEEKAGKAQTRREAQRQPRPVIRKRQQQVTGGRSVDSYC